MKALRLTGMVACAAILIFSASLFAAEKGKTK